MCESAHYPISPALLNMAFLYLGLPIGALLLAQRGTPLAAICVHGTDMPGMHRIRRLCDRTSVLCLSEPNLEDEALAQLLISTGSDALLSFFWPKRIPKAVLNAVNGNAFGVHPSLLPRWRGPDPYFWTIYSSDQTCGVTLHQLEAEYDTGPIVAQRHLPVPEDVNAWQLARRLDRPALELLSEAATGLQARGTLHSRSQAETQARWAPQPDEELLSIRWARPTEDVLRLIRAAAPQPGASTILGNTLVAIVRAKRSDAPVPSGLAPKQAFAVGGSLGRRDSRRSGPARKGPTRGWNGIDWQQDSEVSGGSTVGQQPPDLSANIRYRRR